MEVDQARRSGDFIDVNAGAGQNITGIQMRIVQSKGAIAAIGMITANVELQAAGARRRFFFDAVALPGYGNEPSLGRSCCHSSVRLGDFQTSVI